MSEGVSAERIDHITGCLNGPDVAGLAKGFARELLAEVKRLRGENERQRTTNRDLGKHTMRTMERATAAETEAKQLRARLDEIGETREEWGVQSQDSGRAQVADDEAHARHLADRYSRFRLPGGEPVQHCVVKRQASEWREVPDA